VSSGALSGYSQKQRIGGAFHAEYQRRCSKLYFWSRKSLQRHDLVDVVLAGLPKRLRNRFDPLESGRFGITGMIGNVRQPPGTGGMCPDTLPEEAAPGRRGSEGICIWPRDRFGRRPPKLVRQGGPAVIDQSPSAVTSSRYRPFAGIFDPIAFPLCDTLSQPSAVVFQKTLRKNTRRIISSNAPMMTIGEWLDHSRGKRWPHFGQATASVETGPLQDGQVLRPIGDPLSVAPQNDGIARAAKCRPFIANEAATRIRLIASRETRCRCINPHV